MIKFLVILFIFTNLTFSSSIRPLNNSILNYTHILFEWEQIEDASFYVLQISLDNSFSNIFIETTSSSLIHIQKTDISWNSNYFWRVKGIDSQNNELGWSDTYNFSTGSKRSNAQAITYDSVNVNDGVTIFSSFFDYFSAMIDSEGYEIWNTADNNFVYYTIDSFGKIYGTKFIPGSDILSGIDYSIDNEINWSLTGDSYVHHEFFMLPNGNYIGIDESHQNGPIPEDINPDELLQFQMIGYPTYPSSDFFIFPWVGDRITEWNQQGEIVWTWDTFDHLDWLQDYDLLGDLWLEAFQMGRHDWTHSNALFFDESDSSIYLSSRHLSRIIKIGYPSGNIIWQLGAQMPSGDVDCGHDLNFSFQHSIQILDNGNIVILDNGNNSQLIYDTDYPTSRALEIQVLETENGCQADIIWEYTLPEELFGFASGNVQKLENGNYLITTVGGGATSLEIMPTSENTGSIVWKGNYNLALPSGAIYRAQRLSGLYPIEFSITLDKFQKNQDSILYPLSINEHQVGFTLWNDGELNEVFDVHVNDQLLQSPQISSGDSLHLTFDVNLDNDIHLMVTPQNRLDLSKSIIFKVTAENVLDNDTFISRFQLDNPYPNPFNPIININFYLPQLSVVKILIYDSKGTLVDIIEDNPINHGFHSYNWNASKFSSGLYFIEIITDEHNESRMITLIK